MENSIFEFADKFGVESPFGKWIQDKTNEYPPIITSINLIKALTLPILQNNKNQRQDNFVLVIQVENYADKVEVEYDGKKKTATRNTNVLFGYNGNYIVNLNNLIPAPYQQKEFTFTVKAYDLYEKSKVADIRTYKVIATLDGKVIGGGMTTNESSSIVKDLNKVESISVEQIQAISTLIKKANIEKHIDGINEAIEDNDINTCLRISNFLSQILHESGGLRLTKEGGVSETAYGGYIGRGLIQITGKENYKKYQEFSGEDVTSSQENKRKLENSPHAAKCAGWFWNISSLNPLADNNDFIMITRIINGGFNGYDDRLNYLKGALKSICKKEITILDFSNSKAFNDKRATFAWGLWHDPGLNTQHLNTCKNDKNKSIEGYERFLKLVSSNYSESNWYNILKIPQFATIKKIKTTSSGTAKSYILVKEAAELRLKELKNE